MTGRVSNHKRRDKNSNPGETIRSPRFEPSVTSEKDSSSKDELNVPLQIHPTDVPASIGELTTLLSRHEDERLLILSELLLDTTDKKDAHSQLYQKGLVRAAEALLSYPLHQVCERGLAPWQLKRSITLMQQRSPSRIEIEELADRVGLSPSHFSRAFKASTGLSPYRWQLEIRVKQAQVLLLKRNFAVEDIADRVGFFDSAHFTRVFKKIVGVPPGSWRKNAIEEN